MSALATRPMGHRLLGLSREAVARLEAVPYTMLTLPLRLAVANVFWTSGLTKIRT